MAAKIGTAFVDIQPDLSSLQTQTSAFFASSKWKATSAKAAAGIAGIGAAAVVVGKQLFDLGAEFDTASDKIRTQTGATGKELGKLEKSFKNVISSVPTDFDTASSAIAGLNQRLDLTGRPLTKLAKQFTELSRITGTDIEANVRNVTRAFGDWEVKTKDQAETLDFFFRAAQETGSTVEDLTGLIVQFGAPLRRFGFDVEQATAMFGLFEKAGVNIQTMVPGLKLALSDFLERGIDPEKGLLRTFRGIEEGTIAASDAIEIFGKRAGADMVEAIEQGRFKFAEFEKVIAGGGDTIRKAGRDTRDFGEEWQVFTNRLKVFVEPIASAVFKTVGDGMRAINRLDFKNVIASLRDFWKEAGVLRDVVKRVWEFISSAFRDGFETIKGIVKLIAGVLRGDFRQMWDAVKQIFKNGIRLITAPMRVAIRVLGDIAKRIGSALAGAFSGAWGTIKDIFRGGANAVIDFVNLIIKAINAIPLVPNIDLIGKIGADVNPGTNPNAAGPVRPEKHFSGGKVTRPIAIVGEEAPRHPEYVLATNPAYRGRNLSLWQQAGHDLGIPGFQAGGVLPLPSVGGSVAHNARHYIDKLPDPGRLPAIFQKTGGYLVDKASEYIRDQVTNLVGDTAGAITGPMKSGTGTLSIAQTIAEMFGLSVTSGYRSPAHNAAVGGAPGSSHTRGTPSNPGAVDLVGSMGGMQAALRYFLKRFKDHTWTAIHDAGSGLHLHLGFFRKGGKNGGTGLGLGNLSSFNIDQLTTLAAKHGMANPATMAAIAMAESSGNADAVGDGGFSHGLWQIYTKAWPQFSASRLHDPNYNAKAAAHVLDVQGPTAWTMFTNGTYRNFLGGHVLQGGSSGGGGGGGGGKGGNRPDTTLTVGGAQSAPTFGGATSALLSKIRKLRGLTPRLEEQVDVATTLASFASSPSGAEFSEGERTSLIGLNTGLLGNLLGRASSITEYLRKKMGTKKLRQRLSEELVELQGSTGEGGLILNVKQTLDDLGAASTSEVDSLRAEILAEQLATANRQNAILTAQIPIFSSVFQKAPFGGVFHEGGVVPGPLGESRTIVAQGGETITPAGGSPLEVTLVVNDGAVNPDAIDVRINDRLAQIARTATPAGGVTGRKATYG